MIKKAGRTAIRERHRATCHCGRVELELHLPDGIVDPRRCNCSMCRRRGAIAATVPLAGLRIVKGEAALSFFEYGYNVGCLEGVNPFDLGPVPTSDGVNHPSDRAQRQRQDR